jgi:hypothetical protein
MHRRECGVLLAQYSNAVESFSLAFRGDWTDRKARVGRRLKLSSPAKYSRQDQGTA